MSLLNLQEFQRNLLHFAHNEVPQMLMRRQIEISVHLLQVLQGKTPIDTGFAVSNWRMAVDYIPSGTLGTYQKAVDHKQGYKSSDPYRFKTGTKGPVPARSRDTLIDTAFNRGQDFNVVSWKKIGHVIYVFNNVKYMQVLNNGHSKQAGKFWVEAATIETKVWMQSKGW